jgi:hypothetical protein
LTARLAVSAGPGAGEDRVDVIPCAGGLVIVVADGAGGSGAGAHAADLLLARVRAAAGQARRVEDVDAAGILAEADRALLADRSGGQTTGVIALVTAADVSGASIGDSQAWVIGADTSFARELTERQLRQPLLGSGRAVAVPFAAAATPGATLIVATDGLFKYAPAAKLRAAACAPRLDDVPPLLLELVRLRSGDLPDDVAIAAWRWV